MINRIIFASIVLSLMVAIPLSILGYKYVDMGADFLSFLRSCNEELQNNSISIPSIPNIPYVESYGNWFFDIINLVVTIFNGFVVLINVIISALNTLVQLTQFIFIVLRNLITFTSGLEESPLPNITSII